jgi:hypothetical protein
MLSGVGVRIENASLVLKLKKESSRFYASLKNVQNPNTTL